MAKILVASDAPSVRSEVLDVVDEPGNEVAQVASGPELVASVAEDAPDLVVVDMQMGNMGGMAVCLHLRLEESYGGAPAHRRADALGQEGRCVPGQAVGSRRLGGEAARPRPFEAGHHSPRLGRDLSRRLVPPPRRPSSRVVIRLRRRSRSEGANQPPGSSARGVSDEQERHILSALADLRDTTVSEVMTPRVDVVGLPIPVQAADVAGRSASPATAASRSTTTTSTIWSASST